MVLCVVRVREAWGKFRRGEEEEVAARTEISYGHDPVHSFFFPLVLSFTREFGNYY